MRKYVLLGLVVVVLLAMTSVALAGGYGDWVPGGPNGTSPHTGYSDSSTKCKVCHAVHNAASGGETLLRSTRAEACVYCHLNPGDVSSLNPYGKGAGAETNYTSDSKATSTDTGWYNHSSTHDGNYSPPYIGCASCHSVHSANTFNGGVNILKNDPGLNGGGAIAGAVTNQRDFCRDCHNKAGQNIAAGGCFVAPCHQAGNDIPATEGNISTEYYTASRNGVTHVMTTVLTGNYTSQVAWTASDQCYSCHAAGDSSNGNNFPHYTPNAVQFTSTDYSAANTGMDAVCLNCHVDGGDGDNYTTGVGKTF